MPQQHPFPTTNWTQILELEGDAPERSERLQSLCQAYWLPLYAYVRRLGHSPHDAEDATQGVFAHLLMNGSLERLSPERGRFRGFLMTVTRNYLANQWEASCAQKRGGGRTRLNLDVGEAEHLLGHELASTQTPETTYARAWAHALLRVTLERLEEECRSRGRQQTFVALQPFLGGTNGEAPTYAKVGEQLGLTEAGVASAVRRLRQRFGDLLRREVSRTVANATELEEELQFLRASVGPIS